MRGVVLALMFGAGLAVGFGMVQADGPTASGQRTAPVATPATSPATRSAQAGDLMALASDSGVGGQQLVLVDARTRVIGVYHVDRGTGQVVLKCVRNVQADLSMDDFNSGIPSPQEIRSLLPPR
jgi:hypothetical protein